MFPNSLVLAFKAPVTGAAGFVRRLALGAAAVLDYVSTPSAAEAFLAESRERGRRLQAGQARTW